FSKTQSVSSVVKQNHRELSPNDSSSYTHLSATIMKRTPSQQKLAAKDRDTLLSTLEARFEENLSRHKGIKWAKVRARLEENPGKLWSLHEMERTGGEPDVIGHDKKSGEFVFCDCSPQSPKGRRSVCYDRDARVSRKEHQPQSSALEMAEAMGIDLLSQEE